MVPVESFCPVARTAELIGDVYVLLILRDLAKGPQRFTSLARSLPLNPRTLSQRLHRLEREGLVVRRAFPEIPPRVEYSLTEKGQDLLPILDLMRRWGQRWLSMPEGGSESRSATTRPAESPKALEL